MSPRGRGFEPCYPLDDLSPSMSWEGKIVNGR